MDKGTLIATDSKRYQKVASSSYFRAFAFTFSIRFCLKPDA